MGEKGEMIFLSFSPGCSVVSSTCSTRKRNCGSSKFFADKIAIRFVWCVGKQQQESIFFFFSFLCLCVWRQLPDQTDPSSRRLASDILQTYQLALYFAMILPFFSSHTYGTLTKHATANHVGGEKKTQSTLNGQSKQTYKLRLRQLNQSMKCCEFTATAVWLGITSIQVWKGEEQSGIVWILLYIRIVPKKVQWNSAMAQLQNSCQKNVNL